MKKTLLTLCFLLLLNSLVFAQGATNSWPGGGHFDITSLLIGLVVGAVITYFITKKPKN